MDGQPLLDDEGMLAIEGLTAAHTGYEVAEKLNSGQVKDIDAQIAELTAQKQELLADRKRTVASEHKARETGAYGVEKASERSTGNKVYRHVLEAANADGQHSFWYPLYFEPADRDGRALAGFDKFLRDTNHSLPAVGIFGEKDPSDFTNYTMRHLKISAGLTKRLGGLGLGKRMEQAPGVARRYLEANHFATVPVRGETHVTAVVWGGDRWTEITGYERVQHPRESVPPRYIQDQRRTPLEININNNRHFGSDMTPVLYAPDGELIATGNVDKSVKLVAVGEVAVVAALQIVRERAAAAQTHPGGLQEVLSFIEDHLSLPSPAMVAQ